MDSCYCAHERVWPRNLVLNLHRFVVVRYAIQAPCDDVAPGQPYLCFTGVDPGVHLELPRVEYTDVSSVGSAGVDENVLLLTVSLNSVDPSDAWSVTVRAVGVLCLPTSFITSSNSRRRRKRTIQSRYLIVYRFFFFPFHCV